MPRPKKENVKIKYEPVNIKLELRVGDAGRITIPKVIQESYGIKKGKYVKIKILEVGEPVRSKA
ncbi:hypothetical protein APY94_02885 [Thermococcus celericrescens]|uniref:Uncharacterized protein n=2 Tax=Thermococcus celericrescens TaxID=227598 RepID=A0A117ITM3_9EURY|nr:hypothetical protein APY94_02885 [Thermococcus celericrescens]